MKPCSILLVDNHAIMRDGLRSLIQQDQGFVVVGESADGRSALEEAARLKPDIVVIDIGLAELNGIETTRLLLQANKHLRVVALSMHRDPRYVHAMLEAGASGYITKESAADELMRALKALMNDESYLSTDVSQGVIKESLGQSVASSDRVNIGAREREVLQLIAEGYTSSEIAGRLNISTATVTTHRRNIMRKLGIHGTAQLTKYALRQGLTEIE